MQWYLIIVCSILLLVIFVKLISLKKESVPASAKSEFVPVNFAFDREEFNVLFVAGNQELATGTTSGLEVGLRLFIKSLAVAGPFGPRMREAISELRCALSHHDRADTKGPWNRDLSGYGVLSWKADLYERDEALQRAWPHIESINEELKSSGLGWRY
jgi:hypothetical protein